jgi:hypothetical protein
MSLFASDMYYLENAQFNLLSTDCGLSFC